MPTLRGSTAAAFTSNAQTLTLPVGTVAGDWAVLFAYDGYGNPVLSNITGWDIQVRVTGFGDMILAHKKLTAADITAGSVTVTWSNSYAGYAALSTVLASEPPRVAVGVSTSNGDTGTSRVLEMRLARNTDIGLYWAFKRKDGVTPTVALDRGTSVDASGVSNVGGAYRTETFAADNAAFTLTSTLDSAGNVDAIVGVLMSDLTLPGAISDVQIDTTPGNTALVYKGRTTAAQDVGSVA